MNVSVRVLIDVFNEAFSLFTNTPVYSAKLLNSVRTALVIINGRRRRRGGGCTGGVRTVDDVNNVGRCQQQ